MEEKQAVFRLLTCSESGVSEPLQAEHAVQGKYRHHCWSRGASPHRQGLEWPQYTKHPKVSEHSPEVLYFEIWLPWEMKKKALGIKQCVLPLK